MMIETERLLIRRFTMDDLHDIHQVYVDAQWIDPNETPEREMEKRRQWLEWAVLNYKALANLYQPPYGDQAVVLKASGAMIGSVGLVQSMGPFNQLCYYKELGGQYSDETLLFPEVGLFWAFKSDYQGKGYATEAAKALVNFAFTQLKLRRVIATTSYDNENSMAVMRRLGMTVEKNPLPEPEWFQVTGILKNTQGTQN